MAFVVLKSMNFVQKSAIIAPKNVPKLIMSMHKLVLLLARNVLMLAAPVTRIAKSARQKRQLVFKT